MYGVCWWQCVVQCQLVVQWQFVVVVVVVV